MSTIGVLVVLGLLTLALCVYPRGGFPAKPTRYTPPPHNHSMTLNPNTLDKLSCMFCPLDVDLPASAPDDFMGRVEWARERGVLWGGGGVPLGRVREL